MNVGSIFFFHILIDVFLLVVLVGKKYYSLLDGILFGFVYVCRATSLVLGEQQHITSAGKLLPKSVLRLRLHHPPHPCSCMSSSLCQSIRTAMHRPSFHTSSRCFRVKRVLLIYICFRFVSSIIVCSFFFALVRLAIFVYLRSLYNLYVVLGVSSSQHNTFHSALVAAYRSRCCCRQRNEGSTSALWSGAPL